METGHLSAALAFSKQFCLNKKRNFRTEKKQKYGVKRIIVIPFLCVSIKAFLQCLHGLLFGLLGVRFPNLGKMRINTNGR